MGRHAPINIMIGVLVERMHGSLKILRGASRRPCPGQVATYKSRPTKREVESLLHIIDKAKQIKYIVIALNSWIRYEN